MSLSCEELLRRGQVDYRVKVTNTGKTGGGVSALAFVSSDVSFFPRASTSLALQTPLLIETVIILCRDGPNTHTHITQ